MKQLIEKQMKTDPTKETCYLKEEYIRLKKERKERERNIQQRKIKEKSDKIKLLKNEMKDKFEEIKEKSIINKKESLNKVRNDLKEKKEILERENEKRMNKIKAIKDEMKRKMSEKKAFQMKQDKIKMTVTNYNSSMKDKVFSSRINKEHELFNKSQSIENIRREYKEKIIKINPARQKEEKIKQALLEKIKFEMEANTKINNNQDDELNNSKYSEWKMSKTGLFMTNSKVKNKIIEDNNLNIYEKKRINRKHISNSLNLNSVNSLNMTTNSITNKENGKIKEIKEKIKKQQKDRIKNNELNGNGQI